MTRHRPRPRSLGATLALTALAVALPAAALPAAASAAAPAAATGATTIELKGAPAASLAAQHVRISARRPARASARRIVLPVAGGRVAAGATLRNGGSVSFHSGVGSAMRTVTLVSWQTVVGTRASKVTAKAGGRRITLFTIAAPKRRVSLDRASRTARLTGGSARLTPAGASLLRRGLALRRLAAGPLGRATVAARLPGGARAVTPTTPGGSAPTTPTPGAGSTPTPSTPAPRQCSGFSVGDVPAASAPLAPPAGAASVSAAPMRWYGRDSWIRYINGGLAAGDGFSAGAPAALGPVEKYPEPTESFPNPNDGPSLAYSATFAFDPSHSWYAPAGAASTGLLTYSGSVHFLWAAHGIDLTFSNPEIELNGASSRLVFTVAGAACSSFPAKRVEVLKLTPPAPSGAASPFSYGPIPARVSRDGATLFSDMYFAADPWGSVRDLVVTTP